MRVPARHTGGGLRRARKTSTYFGQMPGVSLHKLQYAALQLVNLRAFAPCAPQAARRSAVQAAAGLDILQDAQVLSPVVTRLGEPLLAAPLPPYSDWHKHRELLQG